MKYKSILITGGAGFIGSNLAVFLKNKYPKTKIFVLDNLIRRGSELNLPRLKKHGIKFVRGDIRNPKDFKFSSKIDLMLECSAEPSVLAGYNDPYYVVETNLIGSINCFEFCRKKKSDVIFLSTSRVYPYQAINNLKTRELSTRFDWYTAGIDEEFTINGCKTLYGATKLSSELLLQEYCDSCGIKGVINRCGVVGGPWQFGKADQGIFTFWMLAHYFKKDLKYIGFKGSGKQSRDLLHIDDLCRLIDIQLGCLDKINGKVYNAGGGRKNSLSLIETTKICQKITGNKLKIGKDTQTRPGDIKVYLTDNKKITKELGWIPKIPPKDTLKDIYNWIRSNEKLIKEKVL